MPKTWDREDLAWAAGLFEGEGTFTKNINVPILSLGMTDEDVVRKFARIIGGGAVYHRQPSGNRKPIWIWFSITFEQAQATTAMLWPWLGERRKARAYELFRGYYEHRSNRGTNTLAFRLFGKRHRDLTPDEIREYGRLRMQQSRERRNAQHPPTDRCLPQE